SSPPLDGGPTLAQRVFILCTTFCTNQFCTSLYGSPLGCHFFIPGFSLQTKASKKFLLQGNFFIKADSE
ncbi:hypothetical protein L2728_08540, partial [Shewanella chilikensis]|uniref:hypothetical protein n=1 Tax=Shewanella chilikensis TaxID=558541 RepID=UPI00200E520D